MTTLSSLLCEHGELSGCFDCIVGGKSAHEGTRATAKPTTAPLRPRFVPAQKTQTIGGFTFNAREHNARLRDAREPMDAEEYAFGGAARADARAEEAAERAERGLPALDAMTDKQRSFLSDLIAKRGTDLHRTLDLDDVSRWNASRLIDELLKLPYRASAPVVTPKPSAPAQRLPDVADGRYAIDIDDTTKFYRVSHGRDGRLWLNVFASDTQYPIHAYETKRAVLTEIARDAHAAMARFGQLIGSCGVCGRTLTDEESRARGIGPICVGRWNA